MVLGPIFVKKTPENGCESSNFFKTKIKKKGIFPDRIILISVTRNLATKIFDNQSSKFKNPNVNLLESLGKIN